ncbi:CDP-glycerol glycerophosphotransferase family protein [Niallia nealsonii]|uniref:CDP-glycerol--glycerophosphate glycerophosphotransferase n=1 Tax=Niallia nealsonii TaxID=115979 RepID=A0A2N0YXW7_9BACI|nr:CDP-glycerol glycerophosphotransferase family protein [Niallia nealsonii]PKG22101.1 CDP-glycerol--glycerophosphate glycerophosphotransferase [Niallia nealsonii]
MVREVFISIYLCIFSFLFNLSKLFPINKNKIVFCTSFTENHYFIYKELNKQKLGCDVVFLANNSTCYSFFSTNASSNSKVLYFSPKKVVSFIQSIYHLATAKVVLVDNYYGFLASINFKKKVNCIQVWHANGAIKRFGLQDPSIKDRSKRAIKRFYKVYQKFDYILVGSKKMEDIFIKAFNVSTKNIKRTGIPRTDIFLQEELKVSLKKNLYASYPILKNKKVILYAPTFRDSDDKSNQFPIDLELLKDRLGEKYVFVLKLHPSVKTDNISIMKKNNPFILDLSSYSNMNDLLFIADFLITDYSSIPFEFSFMQKPMLFYPYDLKDYEQSRGFWQSYESLVPGPIAFSTHDIINIINQNQFDLQLIGKFHKDWNTYSRGDSSKNVINLIKECMNY